MQLGYRLSTRDIETRERTATMREIAKDDEAAIREVRSIYERRALESSGNIDRNEWYWNRILNPPRGPTPSTCYLVECSGKAEGYIILGHKPGTTFHDNILEASEVLALTSEAGGRILAFLSDHRSMAQAVQWRGAPVDSLGHLLGEQKLQIDTRIDWMIRIVDVVGALKARGYPAGLRAELHLDVSDDVLPHNNDRFVLEVVDGRGQVRSGGRGDFKIDVRGLASLYSGHLSPGALQAIGYLNANDETKQSAQAIFASPAPWMSDMF
jgi:predicted acetyltransferase